VEKESLLRELERTPEMEIMRARAQGEVERYKRENSRLSAKIAQFEQEQHEIRKAAATAEHLENRIEELTDEINKERNKLEKIEVDNVSSRDSVNTILFLGLRH
jgi:predicted RNase H-like nuclease (RuvC/YqgF family)